jgi:hypothetical protein
LGGYSDVIKFARGGGTKRSSTALELLHLLKLRNDLPPEAQFSQAISRSRELQAMFMRPSNAASIGSRRCVLCMKKLSLA